MSREMGLVSSSKANMGGTPRNDHRAPIERNRVVTRTRVEQLLGIASTDIKRRITNGFIAMEKRPTTGPRFAADVVRNLLDDMNRIVVDYHPTVGRTARTVADLIQGTAMFPGGCGLWAGTEPFASIPEFFPQNPIMLVAHNFDSVAAHDESRRRGGEGNSLYWKILRGYVDDPSACFFTNALMGLQPASAVGPMPTVAGYETQCLTFLRREIEIVAPRIVVALGGDALRRLRKIEPNAQKLKHPSARELIPLVTRGERIAEQAAILRTLVAAASP
jgi:hypothetical protein